MRTACRIAALPLFLLLTLLFLPRPAAAQPACSGFCNPLVPCNAPCTTNVYTTCLQYNGVCNHDPDGDGVDLSIDNCPSTANPSQANCDGDSMGDACDSLNGTFVASGKKIACASDKDTHFLFVTYEIKYQQKYVDISSCHSPDRWNHSTLSTDCYGVCGELDANGCAAVCRNDTQYSCSLSICMPIGQYNCNPDTIP